MLSFGIRQTFTTAAVLLALGAVTVPCFAQVAFEPVANDERQQRIIDTIDEELARNGPLSTGLIEPWTVLGLSYAEQGDHSLALAATEQARQLVRANYGLASMEEAPLLRRLIENERAIGDTRAAWDLEKELLSLAEQHPDDLRTVPYLRELAEGRLDVAKRYYAGEFPPEIVLGCYYSTQTRMRCSAGSRRIALEALLSEAWAYYRSAVAVMDRNDLPSTEELNELGGDLIRTSYRFETYSVVRRGLVRLVSYDDAGEEPSPPRISALIQLADLDLQFARYRSDYTAVLEKYTRAYEHVVHESTRDAVQALFSPDVPVVLPSFLPNPLTAEHASRPAGYIDVAFAVSRHGKGENIEILDSTANVSRAAERDLVRLIETSSFRPRVVDGRFADLAPVVLRYYVNE